ncbi:MAG: hypothetical protein U0930_14085 [Pirellulales bacterium]
MKYTIVIILMLVGASYSFAQEKNVVDPLKLFPGIGISKELFGEKLESELMASISGSWTASTGELIHIHTSKDRLIAGIVSWNPKGEIFDIYNEVWYIRKIGKELVLFTKERSSERVDYYIVSLFTITSPETVELFAPTVRFTKVLSHSIDLANQSTDILNKDEFRVKFEKNPFLKLQRHGKAESTLTE